VSWAEIDLAIVQPIEINDTSDTDHCLGKMPVSIHDIFNVDFSNKQSKEIYSRLLARRIVPWECFVDPHPASFSLESA